jgi:transcriptional regulator GlxA family with amidase domain
MGKSIGLLLFPQFETLDTYGPVGLIATQEVGDFYNVTTISSEPTKNVISSSHIPTSTSLTIDEALDRQWDILLLPGGRGTDSLYRDESFMTKFRQLANKSDIVFTVCSGSHTLAASGLIDGIKATTNKMLFTRFSGEYKKVKWVRKARWVHDGKYLTASGVSAGMVHEIYFKG